ncbi:MAG TPA: DNA polymerase IV [Acidimicrobiaceae bacterium]|nr:DNA polymerase IV [Acidimicrobiaceae bacterium]HCB37117.1 DNA polymerase IV [Acidimicrobiaceae bacterium]
MTSASSGAEKAGAAAPGPGRAEPDNSAGLPILHVDLDAFFAEVERLADPALAGRPILVGGTGGRGVVASASYEARAAGVRSGMPLARALRLCPQAACIPPNFERYSAASQAARAVFESFTPLVEPISLDEAFLDVGGSTALFGTSAEIAQRVRDDVRRATRLECSVGVASSKTLAKLASVAAKPEATPGGAVPGLGVCVVPVAEEVRFLHALAVGALWGVGRVTSARLAEMGIETVGDLAAVPQAALAATLGNAHAAHLTALASGIDERPVVVGREAKSIGHEETFAVDIVDRAALRTRIVRLADAVSWRLRRSGLRGRTVHLKAKLPDFTLRTRAHTLRLAEPSIDTGGRIAAVALELLDRIELPAGVRLLGISVSRLEPPAGDAAAGDPAAGDASSGPTTRAGHSAHRDQQGLDFAVAVPEGSASGAPAAERSGTRLTVEAERRLAAAIDDIRERFGADAIRPGSGAGPGNRPRGPSSPA